MISLFIEVEIMTLNENINLSFTIKSNKITSISHIWNMSLGSTRRYHIQISHILDENWSFRKKILSTNCYQFQIKLFH
jgi:hypothetical protein